LPVRLDPSEKRRLKDAAARLGMTPSAMIRLLVHSFVEAYDRSGGRLTLPPTWRQADDEASGTGRQDRVDAAETSGIDAADVLIRDKPRR
jgi:hypothetical protein